MLVYEVINRKSLDVVKVMNDKILNACGTERIPRVLVANKCDMPNPQREVSREEGQAIANEMGIPFVEVSAKHAENINQAFHMMLREIEARANPDANVKKNEEGCLPL